MINILNSLYLEDLATMSLSAQKTTIDKKQEQLKQLRKQKTVNATKQKQMIDKRTKSIMRGRAMSPDEKQRLIVNAQKQKNIVDKNTTNDVTNRQNNINNDKSMWKQKIRQKRKELTAASNNKTNVPTGV